MGKELTKEEYQLQNDRQSAVNTAWKMERTRVFMGMGTRDWTKEEQRELIETGRISGYEGHHMKSVKANIEEAKNPDNIQFLTHEEHLRAHDGNYRNATNGYYDPTTGIMQEFGEKPIAPLEEINLTDSLYDYVDVEEIMREVQREEELENLNTANIPDLDEKEDGRENQDKEENENKIEDNLENNVQGIEENQDNHEDEDSTQDNGDNHDSTENDEDGMEL